MSDVFDDEGDELTPEEVLEEKLDTLRQELGTLAKDADEAALYKTALRDWFAAGLIAESLAERWDFEGKIEQWIPAIVASITARRENRKPTQLVLHDEAPDEEAPSRPAAPGPAAGAFTPGPMPPRGPKTAEFTPEPAQDEFVGDDETDDEDLDNASIDDLVGTEN